MPCNLVMALQAAAPRCHIHKCCLVSLWQWSSCHLYKNPALLKDLPVTMPLQEKDRKCHMSGGYFPLHFSRASFPLSASSSYLSTGCDAANRFGKPGLTCGSEVGKVQVGVKMGWLTGMVLDLGRWEFNVLLWVSGGEQRERRQSAPASWLWCAEENISVWWLSVAI